MTPPTVAQPHPPSPSRTWALYFATLGGMLAAFLNEQIQYFLVAQSCGRNDSWTRVGLFLVPAVMLLVALAAVWVGWHYWTRDAHGVDDEYPPDHETVRAEREGVVDARTLATVKRIRFMGLLGAGLSALSMIAIINMSLPLFFLSPCDFT